MSQKKKEVIINNVNIADLEPVKLLRFAQSLYNELLKERKMHSLQQVDKNQKLIFLNNTRDNMTKLKHEMDSMQNIAEQNPCQINDLEIRLRQQRAYYNDENDYNLNNLRLENDEIERKMSSKHEKQIEELFKLNALQQDALKKKDTQHRHQINYMRQKHVKLVYDKTEKLEEQMVQVLNRMEERRLNVFRQDEEKRLLEIQSYRRINDKNMKYTTEKYENEIVYLMTYYDDKNNKGIELTENLKKTIKKYVDRNNYLNQYVLDIKEENKKILGDLLVIENNKRYLEQTKSKVDSGVERLRNIMKNINKYETLYKLKRQENELLEKTNNELKQKILDNCLELNRCIEL